MPNEDEFEETWQTVETYISKIGHTKEANIFEKFEKTTEETDEGELEKNLRLSPHLAFAIESEEKEYGIQARDGGQMYLVHGHSDHELARITYMFDIVSQIASVMNHEQALDLLEAEDEELPDEDESGDEMVAGYKIDAADKFLSSIDADHMRQFKYYLGEKLTSPEVSFKIFTADTDKPGSHLQAFVVSKRIFPYRDDFSIKTYSDSVQSVISIGSGGTSYLENAFIFNIAEKETKTTSDSINIIK